MFDFVRQNIFICRNLAMLQLHSGTDKPCMRLFPQPLKVKVYLIITKLSVLLYAVRRSLVNLLLCTQNLINSMDYHSGQCM